MPTESFEKTFELTDPSDARRAMLDSWVWEYYGLESSSDLPQHSALSTAPIRFFTRHMMTVVEDRMLTATNVELSVRSDSFVHQDHGVWHQEHVLPILDDATAAALADAPGTSKRSFVERRTSWGDGQMRLRVYPLSGTGPASVSFVFGTEASANSFQPPRWPSLKLDSLQERHVYSVEVAKDPTPMEYEVRYLVDPDKAEDFKARAHRRWIGQSYLIVSNDVSLRVRVVGDGPHDDQNLTGQIAVKGPRVNGARLEIQGVVPGLVARSVHSSDFPRVRKYRYSRVTEDDYAWELDEFLEDNSPLQIAECEVNTAEELAAIPKQPFCAADITGDPAYNNEQLSVRPFSVWGV